MPMVEHGARDLETIEQNRRGWNTISASYQAERHIRTDDVHYGPLAPGERVLGLLADGRIPSPQSVAGKRVLEIGCGGGQNAIALAQWGATCVGIDPSAEQLAFARRLARQHGVDVQFQPGVAEDLGAFGDASFDIALSSYAFDYVTNLGQAYREIGRVLKPGGLLVLCLSHPWFQAVGWHLAGDPDAPDIGGYAAWPNVADWDWTFEDGTTARLTDHQRTLAQIINELLESGFILERLVEQPYEDIDQASPEALARLPYTYAGAPDRAEYAIARKLPITLVIRARRGETLPA